MKICHPEPDWKKGLRLPSIPMQNLSTDRDWLDIKGCIFSRSASGQGRNSNVYTEGMTGYACVTSETKEGWQRQKCALDSDLYTQHTLEICNYLNTSLQLMPVNHLLFVQKGLAKKDSKRNVIST